jgi:hypothetical protein
VKCRSLCIVPLVIVLLLTPHTLKAQGDTPGDLAVGLTPYQSFHGGEIDSVNLSNGKLNLNIPIGSYPQRGSTLTYNLRFIIAGTSLHEVEHCDPNMNCYYDWETTGNVHILSSDDQIVGWKSKAWQNNKLWVLSAAVVSPDQSQHLLMYSPSSNSMESVDATGYRSDGNTQTAPTFIIDRDGNRSGLSISVAMEDPNGNQIGTGGDTLGRNLEVTYNSSNGTSNTDFSGCPTPQPITYAIAAQLPGPNGMVQYKFCYASIPTYVPVIGQMEGIDGNETVLQGIVLHNDTTWTFEYTNDRNSGDPDTVNYGELTKVTLPTGGSVSYTYQTSAVQIN